MLGRQLDDCFKSKSFTTLKTFFLRRWLRTIPIYLIVLVLLISVSQRVSLENFFHHITFSFSFFSYDIKDMFFVAAWSLAVEEWFYIIFPTLGLIAIKKDFSKKKFIIIFIIFFFLLKILYDLISDINYHRITLFRLDSIALGYITYIYYA